ncbi:MAG TPA: hypothetical protein VNW92_04045, partial [Polyangiaceae bacterium]|nr:hypothetical protein [Polyangiaceae bacterium]
MYARSSLWLFVTASMLGGCVATSGDPSADTATVDSDLSPGTTFAGKGDNKTQSPIKHVIVIIGENRTFDHVFATYQPKKGQHIDNLLSKGIINADGSPGPNFALATQFSAVDSNPPASSPPLADPLPSGYQTSPGQKTAYTKLPPPAVGGPSTPFITSLA